jgi:ankyrin repeat protein
MADPNEDFATGLSGGDIAAIQQALDAGADPNKPIDTGARLINPIRFYFLAAEERGVPPDVGAIRFLLERGVDPNRPSSDGTFPIHEAMTPAVIAALRAGGADMNAKNAKGHTALTLALSARKSKVNTAQITALLANGADPNIPGRDGELPLLAAFFNGRPKMMIELMAAGANPNFMDPDTDVHIIFTMIDTLHIELDNDGDWETFIRIIETMLQRGVDPNVRGRDGETLLHHTPMICRTIAGMQLISALRRRGVDPNAVDTSGMTMLEMAMYGGHNGTELGHLVTQGFDPNSISPAGTALLHRIVARDVDEYWTAEKLARRVRNTLRLPTINVNLSTSTGETALHLAARRNLYEIIEILLESGADPKLRVGGTAEGALPGDLATEPRVKALLAGGDYTGVSKESVALLEEVLNDAPNVSVCPVCLAYSIRADGCRYMTHVCKPEERDEELYNKFKGTDPGRVGKIEWCVECGRICDTHHKHYSPALANAPRPGLAPVDPSRNPAAVGGIVHYVADCRPSGGGGLGEKFLRFQKYIQKLAELQTQVGKVSVRKVKIATIRDAWNAPMTATPDVREQFEGLAELMRNPPPAGSNEDDVAEWSARVVSLKDFGVNLDVFGESGPVKEETAPDFPRPEADRDLLPIRHEAGGAGPAAAGAGGDNYCGPNLGPHDDGRPTFQFRHRQPDGSVFTHPHDEFICGEDLVAVINVDQFTGKCPINPEACKADLHPDELDALGDQVPEDFRRNYRSKFNRLKAGMLGGKRRKTYRKKKSGRRVTVANDPNEAKATGSEIAKSMFRKLGEDEYTCGVAF